MLLLTNQKGKHDVLYSILIIQYSKPLMSFYGDNTFNPLDVSDSVLIIKQYSAFAFSVTCDFHFLYINYRCSICGIFCL